MVITGTASGLRRPPFVYPSYFKYPKALSSFAVDLFACSLSVAVLRLDSLFAQFWLASFQQSYHNLIHSLSSNDLFRLHETVKRWNSDSSEKTVFFLQWQYLSHLMVTEFSLQANDCCADLIQLWSFNSTLQGNYSKSIPSVRLLWPRETSKCTIPRQLVQDHIQTSQ